MNRSWFFYPLILVLIFAAGCSGETPTITHVLITPEVEQETMQPVETLERELDIVTPTMGDLQPPVDSPTRLPPLDLEEMTADSWFSISPNGAWTAQVQVAYPIDKNGASTGDEYYVRLEVLKQNSALAWTILDRWSPWGLGYTIPANLSWRSDSRRLYFSEQAIADGCAVFGNKQGLFEVNLEDGTVQDISDHAEGELQISPDGRRLAILSAKVLTLRELSSGETVEASLENIAGDWQAGKLLWPPDQSSVIFTVIFKPCGPPESSSIYSMDVGTGELTALIQEDMRVFVANRWLAGDRVELVDKAGAKWRFNPSNEALEKIE